MNVRGSIVLITKWLCFFSAMAVLNSCALFKPMTPKPVSKNNSPFFENVVVTLKPTASQPGTIDLPAINLLEDKTNVDYMTGLEGIEHVPPLIFRYAVLMDVEVEKLSNRKLIEHIHQWWGVPYRIGGSSTAGIDCSAFTQVLASETYGVKLPRTSQEQANRCIQISKDELKEGDLVFFRTGRGISHVGLYLSNNKFVHASTSVGVVISDLNELYWDKRFVKAGRVLN